uniref:Cyclin-T1-3-like isoform X1 n=1 Tax=Tanacetum cinerariifolium TaxID=118510 RepID=A0A6L2K6N7_TANCI|nr:cyclin-T1-3-like isoform X1 [Tanacetum cinerariifolium]
MLGLKDFLSAIEVTDAGYGLEYVKARLLVYKQNESILEENIQLLKVEVQARDTALVSFRQKLNQAEQERDDLNLKLDKFQTSSKSLTKLLASQTNDKHGLGYFSSESDCESLSPSSLSDKSQPIGGYHVVPPPITVTFMPPKPNLVFHTASIDVKTEHSAFNVQLSPTKPAQDLSHLNKPTAPIIKDWLVKATILDATLKQTSPKFNRSGKRKKRKTCFVCKSVDHLIKDCDYHAKKKAQPLPRNYAHRGNHKQYASLTHKKLQKHMDPIVVLTQSKPVFNTAVRPVSADVPKIMVTRPRHAHSINTKSKSPIRRHITRSPSPKTSNSPPKVTTVKALVVSVAQGGTYKQFNSMVMESGGCWYFSRKEIEERSPSRSDGIDLKKENYLRKLFCTFLQDLGMRLKVPQVTIATAIIFCHRFFIRQSHAKNDRRMIAIVCMFLAGKEFNVTPYNLEEVSNQMLELYEQNKMPPSQTSKVLDGSIGGPVTKKARPSAVDAKNATKGSGTHAGATTSRPSDHARTSQDRNKEKFKAALAKRKKARGDVARRTDLIDDDDLLERVLEDEIELAKPSNHRDNDVKLKQVAQPSNL